MGRVFPPLFEPRRSVALPPAQNNMSAPRVGRTKKRYTKTLVKFFLPLGYFFFGFRLKSFHDPVDKKEGYTWLSKNQCFEKKIRSFRNDYNIIPLHVPSYPSPTTRPVRCFSLFLFPWLCKDGMIKQKITIVLLSSFELGWVGEGEGGHNLDPHHCTHRSFC